MTCLQQTLAELHQRDNPLVLDCRPAAAYIDLRLRGSVNIPLERLDQRCYLLPDSSRPMTVVVPSAASYTVTTEADQHGTQHEGATAVYLKGAASLQDFFTTRRLSSVSCYLQDAPELWEEAQKQGLVERGQPADSTMLARRCLFVPSPLLAQSIAGIEAALVQLRLQQQEQLQGHCQPSLAPLWLRALDVGCGSGRDVAWLASRQHTVTAQADNSTAGDSSGSTGGAGYGTQHHQQQADEASTASVDINWRVTGLDEWLGALERAAECAEAMQLSADHVHLLYARVCPGTGNIQPLQVPDKSSVKHSPFSSRQEVTDCEAAAAPCGPAATQQYDLIICCRVLIRTLLPALQQLLVPGGFVVYCTFMDLPGVRAFGRPSGADHLLQPGELARMYFGPEQGFEVVRDDVVVLPDGREQCWFVAQKLAVDN